MVLGIGFRAPEHNRATRKGMGWLDLAMRGWDGRSTASTSSPEQWRTAEGENGLAHDGEALGSIYREGGLVPKVWGCWGRSIRSRGTRRRRRWPAGGVSRGARSWTRGVAARCQRCPVLPIPGARGATWPCAHLAGRGLWAPAAYGATSHAERERERETESGVEL